MIEVTDEMLIAGLTRWEAVKSVYSMSRAISDVYRAMRALETGQKPSIQELSGGRARPLEPWEIQHLVGIQGTGLPLPAFDIAQKSSPDSNDGRSRRLDALTALVVDLARWIEFPPDHDILKRLIAELEAAR